MYSNFFLALFLVMGPKQRGTEGGCLPRDKGLSDGFPCIAHTGGREVLLWTSQMEQGLPDICHSRW